MFNLETQRKRIQTGCNLVVVKVKLLLPDELMFYGGLGLTALTVLLFIAFLCIWKSKSKKLNRQLDVEYGKLDGN